MWKTTLAIATAVVALAGSSDGFAATLAPSFSSHQMSALRIEPPRPGNLYGLPRGTYGSHDIGTDTSAGKPVQTIKRRSR
jgi:hypothetical protein